MKYCSQCGSELINQQDFCTKCGYKLNSSKEEEKDTKLDENLNYTKPINMDTTPVVIDINPIVVDASTKDNFELSKKAKISIIGVSIIVILSIIFFKVGNSITKPSKVVSSFEKAISSSNKKELINILYCNDKRLEINEKNVSPLLSYFKENPSYLNTITQELNKEAIRIESIKKNTYSLTKNDSEIMFDIVSMGKKFIFFPNYKITIKPYFIKINTSIKDVTFSLNDINLGTSNIDNFSKEFGPYIPGKYTLIANYKGKYISINESYDVILFNNEDIVEGIKNIDTLSSINYVKMESEYPDAEIFVNGMDTGAKVADAENFGPLSDGATVYAVATENGKELKSEEYIVKQEDKNIYFSFEEAKNVIKYLESDLNNLINNYTYYFGEAVNINDSSILNPYLYPKSKLYYDQVNYIPITYNKGIRENIISYDILSYNLNADNKSGIISTQETYSINNKGVASVKTFKYTYTFKYNEEAECYQLDSIK